MSSTLLEQARSCHEDIALFEKTAIDVILEEKKTHKESLAQSHLVNEFVEKIQERYSRLEKIYKDEDNLRKEEIDSMYGVGPQVYAKFYERLQEIKDYHKKHPNIDIGRPEAEVMRKEFDISEKLDMEFTGEESYGLYVDLNDLFQTYINLKGASKEVDYIEYLTSFYKFEDFVDKTVKNYSDYLKEVLDYLVSFFKRTQPLFDIQETMDNCKTEFEKQWNEKTYIPIGSSLSNEKKEKKSDSDMDLDLDEDDDDEFFPKRRIDNQAEKLLPWNIDLNNSELKCHYCNKVFSKDTVFNSHINSAKHKKKVDWYQKHMYEVFQLETLINKLASMLTEVIESTKEHLQNRQARLFDEGAAELENVQVDQDDNEGDDDEPEFKMTKMHYPVGWDGQPIPYWLYRLYGLGQEFKCEICGNTSYWGRRAFEKHFTEWRHAHGMKCLGLENTKEFFEITKIQDALDLAKKLERDKKKAWNPETMEEFEDPEGYVVDKETYDLLSKNV